MNRTNKIMISSRLFVLALIALLAGACSRGETVRCASGSYYLAAESSGLLRIPDDLDVPDESEALVVPAAPPPRETDEDSLACLEYSPAFLGADEDED
jgi:hypothetical protein